MPAARFARRLNCDHLTKASIDENPWFRELLRSWRVSGTPADMTSGEKPRFTSTRLAVRDGYMTFYTAGNQTARVDCTLQCFNETVHERYLDRDIASGKGKQRANIPPPTNGNWEQALSTRIENGFFNQLGEKCFVDEVVGANSGVIDLEATLSLLKPSPKHASRQYVAAVRLDMVALEPFDGGSRIALWEAKLFSNSGAKSKTIPKSVTGQINDYKNWFAIPQNVADFIMGCRDSCRYLVRLHELADYVGNPKLAPLDPAILAIGTDSAYPLTLDNRVRYLIDARSEKASYYRGSGHSERLANWTGSICQVVEPGASLKLRTA